MSNSGEFAEQKVGHFHLCEGGTETEIMYKYGFDFPHFAVFELLENPKEVAALEAMYRKYFEVVAKHEMSALVGGLDYRASPDWEALLGYSTQGLADKNLELDHCATDGIVSTSKIPKAATAILCWCHACLQCLNVDLPWTPGLLEQRIGRVHCMGQKQAVQVFVFN